MINLEKLKTLREAISKEPGLITGKYCDDVGNSCALGSLIPYGERINKKEFNVYKIANNFKSAEFGYIIRENDGFIGTPVERKEHMLQYLDKLIVGLEAIEAIVARKLTLV